MDAPDLVLRSRRVVTPKGVMPASIVILDGVISELASYDSAPKAALDLGTLAVLPGLVDTHVHVNDPGRSDWESFETATKAAAAGGITTIVDMPLNSVPVTTSPSALTIKQAATKGRLWSDCGFWGGLVPGNSQEIEPILDAGALGFKAFLIDSGIEEFPPVLERDLRAALPALARRKAPLLVHAELCSHAQPDASRCAKYAAYLASRPKSMENAAIELMLRLGREYGARVHVVHLSSAEALGPLAAAKKEGSGLSAETCPHYLSFAAEDIPDGRTEFKCSPPIRERANRERLWAGLAEGTIDCVVSDHSPCPPSLKAMDFGDFQKAWGGISSLQLSLSAVWTQAQKRGFSLEDLARWLSEKPAFLAGLARKGKIEPGCDADLAVFDPEGEFVVEPEQLHHKHKLTPYAGRRLKGIVRRTYLRGVPVYEYGQFSAGPRGRMILSRQHADTWT